jgi:16S rRNA (cytosine967-C5)-methyltransferase
LLWTLVQETVRWQARLDAVIAPLVHQPFSRLEGATRVILRLVACQVCLLDQIPDHAIVDEAVRLARHFANPGAERLVNAVSRRLVGDGKARWAAVEERSHPENWPVLYSHPSWLVERWRQQWGEGSCRSVLEWNNVHPPIWLRARPEGPAPPGQPGWVPNTYRMPDGYRPATDPAFQEGQWTVQDPSETLVTLLAPPTDSGIVVDLCAAPGTKTSHLVSRFPGQEIVAIDRTRFRVQHLLETLERTGGGAQVILADGETPPLADGCARGVLVDAPCSALGVLRRRVDARWNTRRRDLPRFARQQTRLLRSAAALVAVGGWLLYSVCTTEPEETDHVRKAFLAGNRDFRARSGDWEPPEQFRPSDGVVRIIPGQADCDGVYACLFERIERGA